MTTYEEDHYENDNNYDNYVESGKHNEHGENEYNQQENENNDFDEFPDELDFDEEFDEDNNLDLPEKPSVRFSDQVEEIAIPSRRKPVRCGNPNCKVDHSLPQQKEEDKKYSDGMWTTAILVILVVLAICLYLYFKWNMVRLKSICWILLIILIIVACLRSYFEISETKPI